MYVLFFSRESKRIISGAGKTALELFTLKSIKALNDFK
jgi:hypothetical protein